MQEQSGASEDSFLEMVRQVLRAHAKEDVDYVVRTTSEEPRAVKVLLRSIDLVGPNLTVALNDLLSSFPDNEIRLLRSAANWQPMLPESGFRVALGRLDSIPPTEEAPLTPQAAERTRALQIALSQVLSEMGREHWRGEGDYWIFDDWVGPYSQKVIVWNIEFVTSELLARVQRLLREFPDCEVFFSLDENTPHPASGIRVTARSLDEHWDRTVLRSLFGDRLKY